MSTIGLAPRLVEDGPLPIPPKYRLLDVAQQLQEGDPHWQAGVSVWSYPPDVPSLWNTCDHDDAKNLGDTIPNPQFDPFTVYLPVTCTSRSLGGDSDEWRMRAVAALDAEVSWGVEREFSQGIANPLNPYLGDANAQLLGGGATYTVVEGIAALEDAIAATGKAGVIHLTPALGTRVADHYLTDDTGGVYRTKSAGTPVVVSGGYVGADPTGGAHPPVPGAPGVGSQYAFATGPVRYIQSEDIVVAGTLRESFDRNQNLITFYAERNFVVYWDTVLQAAALIGSG